MEGDEDLAARLGSSDLSATTSREHISLAVFCPTRPSPSGSGLSQSLGGPVSAHGVELYPQPTKLDVAPATTVKELKVLLESVILGGPAAESQSLLWHGRRLADDEVLAQVVQGVEQPEMGYALHLTCPPEHWKLQQLQHTTAAANAGKTTAQLAAERLTALSTSLSQTPSRTRVLPGTPLDTPTAATPLPSLMRPLADQASEQGSSSGALPVPPMASSSTSALPSLLSAASALSPSAASSSWKTFTNHLAALSIGQKADFIGRLSRAERYYATLVRISMERQGPQMTVIGAKDIQALRQSGQIGTAFSSQTPEEMEESIEMLLDALELLEGVKTSEKQAEKDFDAMLNAQVDLLGSQISSQVVNIAGFPFLLQIPPQFAVPAAERKKAFIQMRKYQAVHLHLSTMLSIIRNQQQASHHGLVPFQSSSRNRLQIQQPLEGGALLPPVAGMPAPQMGAFGAIGVGQQAAGRLGAPRARLAVVINLDEIIALALPLLFLSVKLAFLIYIFGKHATKSKRLVMCAMAVAWVIWEGVTIRRRRRSAQARRQQQRDGAQRPPQPPDAEVARQPAADERANGHVAPPPNGQDGNVGAAGQMPAALAQLRDRLQEQYGQQQVARRPDQANGDRLENRNRPPGSSSRSSSNRLPPNRMSPKYWLYMLAKVGLSAESREMGLSRSALRQMQASRGSQPGGQASQAVPSTENGDVPSAIRIYQAQHLTPRRAIRNFYVGLVLFVGTLIPEVERLRKKALLKRDKKLAELELARRQLHLASLEAELKRLEEERRTLEVELGSSRSKAEERGQTATPSTANAAGGTATGAGGGSDDVGSMFDPPFDDGTVRSALSADGRSGGQEPAGHSASARASDASNSITIDTSTAAARPDLLAPPQAGLRADNARPGAEEDISAPSTPLLSPAEADTEDEDNAQDGVDDEVGMILF